MNGHPGFETQREEVCQRDLPVEGDLPDWLRGRYVQNGPGQFEVGGEPLVHWFDPLAMVRGFAFDDGITYTNRFVRSRDFAFAREHGRVRTRFPGTPPDRPVWTRLRQALTGEFPDNPVIGLARIDGQLAAITESPVALTLDPETLSTTGRIDLTAGLDVDLTLGHPHYDPRREALVNLGVTYGRETAYTLFRRGEAGPEPVARIDPPDAPYVHSFALTYRYAVVPATPVGVDTTRLLAGAVTEETFLDALDRFDRPATFLIVDREAGRTVARVRAAPFFVFHHANAFKRDDELVVDLVAFPDERAITDLRLGTLQSADPALPQGDLVRYRLPIDGGRAGMERIRDGPLEFPVVDYPDRLGREHEYVYAVAFGDGPLPTRIEKISVPGGTTTSWAADGCHPGEAVFVPAPDRDEEDEGLLLSVVLDARDRESFLLVLDATTMTELARARLPHRLPYGFHGQFYAPPDPVRSMA